MMTIFCNFAETLEETGGDWPLEQAQRIYRRLGRDDKYLELRSRKLIYGMDYYDLATHYVEKGDPAKALEVAEEGWRKGKGRMTEIRAFLADHALRSGDRATYLEMLLLQTIDSLSLKSYTDFAEACTEEEWPNYEPRLMAAVAATGSAQNMPIYMHRGEYATALAILKTMTYAHGRIRIVPPKGVVERLEEHFPQEILQYYLSMLGPVDMTASRSEYNSRAHLLE